MTAPAPARTRPQPHAMNKGAVAKGSNSKGSSSKTRRLSPQWEIEEGAYGHLHAESLPPSLSSAEASTVFAALDYDTAT